VVPVRDVSMRDTNQEFVQEGQKCLTVIKFCCCFAPAQATGGLMVCHFDSGARPRACEKAEVKQRALVHAVSCIRVIARKSYEVRIEYE
jgi:hypothetical protein